MARLPDNWVTGYDGQRWFFQYEPTGMVQYHFPQEGDEYAEFLLDVGTGPIKLTPEDSLAVEQESKRRSIPSFDDNLKSGPKTSGSKREKKKIGGIEEEYGMSATGYFDSSAFFPDAYDTASPLGDDDPEDRRINPSTSNFQSVAAELPGSSQQAWSPVGFVAELATQDTVKCAEELAPIELDATSYTPAPIQTNIAQDPAELPTHRTPVENKTLVLKPTQPVMQPVDSYPLVHASFTYPPLKSDMNSTNGVSHDAISMGKRPAEAEQNKFQPWKPTQGVAQQSQQQNMAPEALPQTSVLQNQDSELGSFGRKNTQNPESSTTDLEASSIPAVLQPAHRPGEESSSLGTANQQVVPGNQARHDSISVPAASHVLSYTPSALKPGGSQPNNSLQESEGNYTQGSILPQRPSEQVTQVSSIPNDHPSIMGVNTLPDRLPSANPKMNGSPGFLFFHEIPSKADSLNHGIAVYHEDSSKPSMTPQTSGSGRMDSQSRIGVDEQIPVDAPLNFVKRHSSKSSQVSSITPETPSGKPALAGSDEISDVISVISSFTPQGTPAPGSRPSQQSTHTALGDNSKPNPTSMSEGVGTPADAAASGRPQPLNQQLPSPTMTMQQSNTALPLHGQVTSATVNVSKPISVTATPMSQVNMTTSPSNTGMATTQNRPNIQAAHHPPPSIQGSSSQNHHPSMSLPSQAAIPGKVSMSPGPLKPQGNASTPFLPQTSAAIAPGRPPSQASNIPHANPTQLGAQNNYIHHTNNAVQQTQANVPTSHVNGLTQIPVATSVQQALHHPLGQNSARPHSIVGPPTFEHPQSAIQKPQLQHPVMVGPSSQQSAVQPPVAHHSIGPNTAHISSQPPYQHSSPVTQSVSPIQSQVSSPAQSVASLYVSQTSTPVSTFATMNNHTGPSVNSNQTNIAPIRPSSVPAHALSQQVGNVAPPVGFHSKPSSPAGIAQAQSFQTPNPSAKPYPMLPGQVTPLPSQLGSAPFPPPVQQPIPNNYANPAANTPQTAVGQQPMQTTSGGPIQHHVVPGQMNPILNPPQGNVVYGQASSQAQMRPPQQQTPSPHSGAIHAGGYQPSAYQPQPQHIVSYPSPTATSQPNNSHTMLSPSAGSLPAVGQYTFPPPPVAQAQQLPQSPVVASPVTATQGRPFTSAQATAALTDAGKGMKKWAKKVWKNPAIKQTAVGIGGAWPSPWELMVLLAPSLRIVFS
ncbi:hypothetical protein F4782DRAFT_82859 [Xylaria castorea]|nr:hypothetical protein F4782DRAFT_82859 [Xylaria castorea]